MGKTLFYLAQQAQSSQPPADPLINQGGEDIIYLGVGLLAVVLVLIAGILSRRIEVAVILSLVIAAVMIALAVLL